MALFITFGDERSDNSGSITWKIGETIHEGFFVPRYLPPPVTKVEANGDELAYVLKWFKNLPIALDPRDGKILEDQVWHGDFAKFIAHHLPRAKG